MARFLRALTTATVFFHVAVYLALSPRSKDGLQHESPIILSDRGASSMMYLLFPSRVFTRRMGRATRLLDHDLRRFALELEEEGIKIGRLSAAGLIQGARP